MTICTLDKDINKCICYDPETSTCTSDKPCGMTREEIVLEKQLGYERKERWYEKYYKR